MKTQLRHFCTFNLLLAMAGMLSCNNPRYGDSQVTQLGEAIESLTSQCIAPEGVRRSCLEEHLFSLDSLLIVVDTMKTNELDSTEILALQMNRFQLHLLDHIARHPKQRFLPSLNTLSIPMQSHSITLQALLENHIWLEKRDYRIPLAINTFTKGDVYLYPHAFQPDSLDTQLDRVAKKRMSHPHFIRWKGKSELLLVPSLLREPWLGLDTSETKMVNFIKGFRPPGDTLDSSHVMRFYPTSRKINALPERR